MFALHVWTLPLLLLGVWFLWAFAAVAEKRADEIRRGVPEAQRGGVSIFPAIPLFPLFFWGAAWLIDHFFSPWGSIAVGGIHIFLALLMLATILRDVPFRFRHDRRA